MRHMPKEWTVDRVIREGSAWDSDWEIVDSIATVEARIAELEEAVRVLAERLGSCEHMLACYRVGRRPSESALDRSRTTDDNVNANPITHAAVEAARKKGQ
jgi:hypothetical protein